MVSALAQASPPPQGVARRIAIIIAYMSDAEEAERQLGIAYLSPDVRLHAASFKGLSP